ncbi:Y+l amino acid transporter 2 [Plakobranchus ocellatus]|uniref:Y+l amino acid transporter 2 n=1 Tax=Plakobranchus ocellatus TaxID=259542 RepID=A0AAV4AH91_9GAST|nr:Y+l amino acid transporter 2 [Plakobranchus ocellatus]
MSRKKTVPNAADFLVLKNGVENHTARYPANTMLLDKRPDAPQDDQVKTEKVELKRNVSLVSGIALIIGTMIGSGIFISPKGMLEGSGSVGMTLVLWLLCGLLVTMGALVYAELGTMIPESGGEHAYLMFTFDKTRRQNLKAGAAVKYGHPKGSRSFAQAPAFVYDWVALFIIRPTMFAIMALALGTYAVKPFYPDCDPPEMAIKLTTAVAMCIISFINCASVKAATYVQNITTFTKLLALAIISIGGIVMLLKGQTENFEDGFQGTTSEAGTVAIAFYNGLWAFDGWNSLNFITEELKDPTKNLPRAIMIGIPLTTLAYILANIGYLAVMSKEEIMLSHAVAVTWGDRMLGVMSWIIPCFVVASTFGSSNGCLFASGRVTEPNMYRPYKVPLPIPIIVLLASIYLVIAPIVQNPGSQFVYAVIFILAGLVLYVPFIYRGIHFKFIDTVTIVLQKLLQLAPTGN